MVYGTLLKPENLEHRIVRLNNVKLIHLTSFAGKRANLMLLMSTDISVPLRLLDEHTYPITMLFTALSPPWNVEDPSI